MPDKIDLLVSNLQESVKSLQTFMLSGLGASTFFALLAFSSAREIVVETPAVGSSVPVSIDVAFAIALSAYWVAVLMATLLFARANRLVHLLAQEAPELVEPALLYPAVVTLRVWGPRLVLALVPAVLVIAGSIRLWGAQLLAAEPILGLLFLVLPSLILAFQLRRAIGGYAPSEWGD